MFNDDLQKIFILGIGGHGWQSIKQFLLYYKGPIVLSIIPADWGGSTGVIGRTFEYNNYFLNKQLHGDENFEILPFGDLNKFISEFLKDNFGEKITTNCNGKTVNILNFRSDKTIDLINIFNNFANYIKLEETLVNKFTTYIKTYQKYYLKIKNDLDTQSTTSLGNLWHSFLYFEKGGIEGICYLYKEKNILPKNIKLIFTNNTRLILTGSYQTKDKIINNIKGEDAIDVLNYPINPKSLVLVDKDGELASVDSKFILDLKTSDLIIIPNGSIANWLPLINIKVVEDIIQEKSKQNKVIMLMNLFFSQNEYPNDVYSYYLKTKSIDIIMFSPSSVPEKFYYSFVIDYRLQGKNINYNLNTNPKKNIVDYQPGYNNCLDLITSDDDISVEGLKHDQNSVKKEIIKYIIYLYFTSGLN